MAGKVLYRMPGDGDPVPPLPSLGQALSALHGALQDDLASPARHALESAEAGDMPETVAAGLLAMAVEGEALRRLLQAMEDVVQYHTPGSHRHRRGEPPFPPDLVAGVERAERRWAMLRSGINAMFVGARQDAAECERMLIELDAGRAQVTADGVAIVEINAGPGGTGKPGRAK